MRFAPRVWVIALAAVSFALAGQDAKGAFLPATFAASSGDLSASAQFTASGNTLTIVLTNTSSVTVHDNADVLTGVFFDITPAVALPGSATLTSGSVYAQTTNVTGFTGSTNLGNEWSFEGGSSPLHSSVTQHFGLSTVGLGIFDTPIDSTAPNLDNSTDNGQTDFGLVNVGFNDFDGNGGLDNRVLVVNSITFTLTLQGISPVSVTNVRFQYGTGLNEPHLDAPEPTPDTPAVPAPAGLILLASAAPMLALRRVFRRKLSAA